MWTLLTSNHCYVSCLAVPTRLSRVVSIHSFFFKWFIKVRHSLDVCPCWHHSVMLQCLGPQSQRVIFFSRDIHEHLSSLAFLSGQVMKEDREHNNFPAPRIYASLVKAFLHRDRRRIIQHYQTIALTLLCFPTFDLKTASSPPITTFI